MRQRTKVGILFLLALPIAGAINDRLGGTDSVVAPAVHATYDPVVSMCTAFMLTHYQHPATSAIFSSKDQCCQYAARIACGYQEGCLHNAYDYCMVLPERD